jgi:hypothetical protein
MKAGPAGVETGGGRPGTGPAGLTGPKPVAKAGGAAKAGAGAGNAYAFFLFFLYIFTLKIPPSPSFPSRLNPSVSVPPPTKSPYQEL